MVVVQASAALLLLLSLAFMEDDLWLGDCPGAPLRQPTHQVSARTPKLVERGTFFRKQKVLEWSGVEVYSLLSCFSTFLVLRQEQLRFSHFSFHAKKHAQQKNRIYQNHRHRSSFLPDLQSDTGKNRETTLVLAADRLIMLY